MAQLFTARSKIKKPRGATTTPLEDQVAQALYDLEANSDLKGDLKELHIVGAKEVPLKSGKKAVVITVPFPQLRSYHKIQVRLVRELEKKYPDQHVVFVGFRRILPRQTRTNKVKRQKRPRNRTLTAVHDSILEDIVFPTEIVGKRTRVRHDTSHHLKVYLDRKDQQNVEHKLDTFAAVYKKLTGKEVAFEFPTTGKEEA